MPGFGFIFLCVSLGSDIFPFLQWVCRRLLERHLEIIFRSPTARFGEDDEGPIVWLNEDSKWVSIWLEIEFVNNDTAKRYRVVEVTALTYPQFMYHSE